MERLLLNAAFVMTAYAACSSVLIAPRPQEETAMQVENRPGPSGHRVTSSPPDPIGTEILELPDLKASDEATREAYERGGEAGMRDVTGEENPYPERSVLAKAFEHGYLDGQKVQR
jgi:hypothetical protein